MLKNKIHIDYKSISIINKIYIDDFHLYKTIYISNAFWSMCNITRFIFGGLFLETFNLYYNNFNVAWTFEWWYSDKISLCQIMSTCAHIFFLLPLLVYYFLI